MDWLSEIQPCTHAATCPDVNVILHDIRNHLYGVNGVVQLMSDGVTRIGQHDAIGLAQQCLNQLLRKIQQLQLVQSLPGPEAAIGQVDCAMLAAELCATYTPVARRQGLHIKTTSNGQRCVAHCDHAALHRILSNLLVNAIKHAQARHVEVRVRGEATHVVFTVQDDGQGLSPECENAVAVLAAGGRTHALDPCSGLALSFETARFAGMTLRLEPRGLTRSGVAWVLTVPAEARPG